MYETKITQFDVNTKARQAMNKSNFSNQNLTIKRLATTRFETILEEKGMLIPDAQIYVLTLFISDLRRFV